MVRVAKTVDDLGQRRGVIVKIHQLFLETIKRAIVSGGGGPFCRASQGRIKASSQKLQGNACESLKKKKGLFSNSIILAAAWAPSKQ